MDLRHTHRLYMPAPLSEGQAITPCAEHAHYLRNVVRLKMGETVRSFNDKDGEWAVEVSELGKKSLTLTVKNQIRMPQNEPDLWLCAAPIKKAHFDYMIEKATELGIAVFQPILTARTQIREVNVERCRMIAIEAAEQSDRLSIPEIKEPLTLDKLIKNWNTERRLIIGAEWGDAESISSAQLGGEKATVLVGPEGGFAAEEFEKLRPLQNAVFVRLGPRILRADTAAIAMLTCWQVQSGDWRST